MVRRAGGSFGSPLSLREVPDHARSQNARPSWDGTEAPDRGSAVAQQGHRHITRSRNFSREAFHFLATESRDDGSVRVWLDRIGEPAAQHEIPQRLVEYIEALQALQDDVLPKRTVT